MLRSKIISRILKASVFVPFVFACQACLYGPGPGDPPPAYGYGGGYSYYHPAPVVVRPAPVIVGDYDAHHVWHDREWWMGHDRGWVEAHHHEWLEHHG
jgi:hypothetical protein